MDNQPLPFPTNRRPSRTPRPPAPDHTAAILERLAALSDAIDDLAEIVIAHAARENRPR